MEGVSIMGRIMIFTGKGGVGKTSVAASHALKAAKEGLKTILAGIEKIKEGYSIFIMPEGTRNKEEGVLPFHEGSFKLAQKTGCPIIPVAITNTDKAFEKHIPWIKKTNTSIRYGEPIYIDELTKEEMKFLGVHSKRIIETMLEPMRIRFL